MQPHPPLRITRLASDVPMPTYKTAGAACFDIAAYEDIEIPPHSVAHIRTGLVFGVPEGYFLLVASRSSTPSKLGLITPHGFGILDHDYCGPEDELKLIVWNGNTEPVRVRKGDRVSQAFLMPVQQTALEEGPPLGATRGGIGSTGQQ